MAAIDVDWVACEGAVRFTVAEVPDDGLTTVKRVQPGGALVSIRGYPDGAWHAGLTGAFGYDWEMPLSVFVEYAIVKRDQKNLAATDPTDLIFTQTPGRT